MKQQKVIKILDDLGIITVTEDSKYNDKCECIYTGIDILCIKYLLRLEFDDLTNLTSVKLAPPPAAENPTAPAFITSTDSDCKGISTKAFKIFLSKVFSILIKHKIKLLSAKENKFYKIFNRRTYTLYIGNDGTELNWEAIAKDGGYIIYANQAGYGQYLYTLYGAPKPNSGDYIGQSLGSYVHLDSLLNVIVNGDKNETAKCN